MNAHATRYELQRARELPANIEAEQAILGALLVNNDALNAIPETFDAIQFFDPIHEQIFEEAKRGILAGKRINPVTIKASLPTDQMVGDMTISQYLARLAASVVSIVNVPDYCTAVTICAMKRSMILLGEKMQDLGFSAGDEISLLEQGDANKDRLGMVLRELVGEETSTLADAADAALGATNNAYMGKGSVGVDYGFEPMMQLIGPLMPGQMCIIGGATKSGKSSLIEQIVMGAAMNGHPVWIYSGEMKAVELAHRALSRITDIQAWRQIRGKVSEAEYEKLMQAKKNAETWQSRVFIHDRGMTIGKIEKSLERFSGQHENSMGVVDHIGLIERDKATSRMSDYEFGPVMTRSIKMIASKANLPIVAAAQLKKNTFVSEDRALNKKAFQAAINRRPKYTDLIGACEQDANHVIIPFRAEPILEAMKPSETSEAYPDWEEAHNAVKDKAEIILSLSRHAYWPMRKDVRWNGKKTQFEPINSYEQGRFF